MDGFIIAMSVIYGILGVVLVNVWMLRKIMDS